MTLKLEATVEKLELDPGDTLVVQLQGVMPSEVMLAMREALEQRFPGVQIVVTDPSVELTIVKSSEVESGD